MPTRLPVPGWPLCLSCHPILARPVEELSEYEAGGRRRVLAVTKDGSAGTPQAVVHYVPTQLAPEPSLAGRAEGRGGLAH